MPSYASIAATEKVAPPKPSVVAAPQPAQPKPAPAVTPAAPATQTQTPREHAIEAYRSAVSLLVAAGVSQSDVQGIFEAAQKAASGTRVKLVVFNDAYGGFGVNKELGTFWDQVLIEKGSTEVGDMRDDEGVEERVALVEAARRYGESLRLKGIPPPPASDRSRGPSVDLESVKLLSAEEDAALCDKGQWVSESGAWTQRRLDVEYGLRLGRDQYSVLNVQEVPELIQVRIREYDGFETVIPV